MAKSITIIPVCMHFTCWKQNTIRKQINWRHLQQKPDTATSNILVLSTVYINNTIHMMQSRKPALWAHNDYFTLQHIKYLLHHTLILCKTSEITISSSNCVQIFMGQYTHTHITIFSVCSATKLLTQYVLKTKKKKKQLEASLNINAMHVPDKPYNIGDFPLSLLQSGLLTHKGRVGQKLWQ